MGLRMAARQDLTMLGSLAVAIQNSATLGDALECTTRYLFVHGRSLSLTLGEDPSGARGGAGLYYGPAGAEGPIQGTDLAVGFIHRTITYLCGGRYGLLGVDLPYRPPASTAVYEEFFGAPVRVARNVPAAVLRIPRRLLEQRLEGVNDTLRQLALAFLAEQATPSTSMLTPRVRAAIQESMGAGTADITTIGRLLTMHPRTLQRHLDGEGTTFGAILEDVRRHTAHRLLTTTDLPIGQVSTLVGFAEQSALSRAAQRWWGSSPRRLRADAVMRD